MWINQNENENETETAHNFSVEAKMKNKNKQIAKKFPTAYYFLNGIIYFFFLLSLYSGEI